MAARTGTSPLAASSPAPGVVVVRRPILISKTPSSSTSSSPSSTPPQAKSSGTAHLRRKTELIRGIEDRRLLRLHEDQPLVPPNRTPTNEELTQLHFSDDPSPLPVSPISPAPSLAPALKLQVSDLDEFPPPNYPPPPPPSVSEDQASRSPRSALLDVSQATPFNSPAGEMRKAGLPAPLSSSSASPPAPRASRAPRDPPPRRCYARTEGTPLFGVPLSTLKPEPQTGVNLFVYDMIEALNHFVRVEGLFRIPGGSKHVDDLKEKFDKGEGVDLDPDEVDPHELASLLKQFLRELPEPLFAYDLYYPLINTQSNRDDESRLECMKILLESLPKENLKVAGHVCRFLRRVADNAEFNRMNAENLAMVFAPNVLRPKTEVASTIHVEYKEARNTFEDMVRNAGRLFRVS